MRTDMPIQVSPALDLIIRRGECDRPEPFPMALLRPHEMQAFKNHDQSLEMLASRGGCGASELVAILEDRPWSKMDEDDAFVRLAAYVLKHGLAS